MIIRQCLFNMVIILLAVCAGIENIQAQKNCIFMPPVVKIDFGAGDIKDINSYLPTYERDFTRCPADGFYAYASATDKCFAGDWLTIREDHSADSENGNMMLVNASETGGVFFNTGLSGFKGATTYQITLSMMNVCRINGGCPPLPPDISISLLTPDGRKAAVFKTGRLTQRNVPHWKQLSGFFKTPPGVTTLRLVMENNTLGGCGNDFAMDDIIIRECYVPALAVKAIPQRVSPKPVDQKPPALKPVPVSEASSAKKPGAITKKPQPAVISETPPKRVIAKIQDTIVTSVHTEKPEILNPSMQNLPPVALPALIITRANPVVKQIEAAAGSILIELYDNGEIDGDTVTIYHNNQVIVSKAGLSAKPVSFRLDLEKLKPHHEIIMVAENLGSIPPNTSMMIITAGNSRYEVFVSSSEQKNAKVVIDLKN